MTSTAPGPTGSRSSHVDVDHRRRLYSLICEGEVDGPRALPATREAFHQASEMGYALLFDLRAARLELGLSDAPRLLETARNPWGWKFRVSLLSEGEWNLEWLRFVEGIAPNAGVAARVFEDAAEAREWGTEAARDPLKGISREGIRILVVDDDPDILLTSSRSLERAGFQVSTAESGAECRDLALRDPPDLILLDVVLGDTDGREVCKELKAEARLSDTYIALASGIRTRLEDQKEGLASGADGYIPRPLGLRELVARVEILLLRRELDRSVESGE